MERGVNLDPRYSLTGGSAATALFRSIGIAPLGERVLQDEIAGAAAGAHLGGRTDPSLVGMRFEAVHLDLAQAYVDDARMIGVSDLLLASAWDDEDTTDDLHGAIRGFAATADPIAFIAEHDLFARYGTTVAMMAPNGGMLPYREQSARREYVSRFGPLHGHVLLPYMALDLFGAVLYDAPAPTIEQAWRLRPSPGRKGWLHRVRLPGGVVFDPSASGADLYRSLAASRVAVRTDPSVSAVARRRREEGMKSLNVAAAYGLFVREDRVPLPKNTKEEVELIDPWGRRFQTEVTGALETPGPDHCPLLGAAVTATTRFVIALIERLATDHGGTVAQVLVDAVTLPARPNLRADT
jgi:hypothetical protein